MVTTVKATGMLAWPKQERWGDKFGTIQLNKSSKSGVVKAGVYDVSQLDALHDMAGNASSATLEQAIRRIQDFDGPVIYCIGLLFGDDSNRGESRHAMRMLQTLSEETGGQAYFPKSLKEVDPIAKEVAEDIRTQYTIAYHSTKSPALGGYRQVHVEAKEKGYGKLSVRTRSGYYSPGEQYRGGQDARGRGDIYTLGSP